MPSLYEIVSKYSQNLVVGRPSVLK